MIINISTRMRFGEYTRLEIINMIYLKQEFEKLLQFVEESEINLHFCTQVGYKFTLIIMMQR